MTAFPGATPRTFPLLSTVTMAVASELQVTVFPSGVTVAVSCCVPPTGRLRTWRSSVTEVSATGFGCGSGVFPQESARSAMIRKGMMRFMLPSLYRYKDTLLLSINKSVRLFKTMK